VIDPFAGTGKFMAETPKRKTRRKAAKKGKRGRPEQRLVITEDPQTALARLLKTTKK
jgi:hypothetical protein